jgi:hypothetical protein
VDSDTFGKFIDEKTLVDVADTEFLEDLTEVSKLAELLFFSLLLQKTNRLN